MYDVIDELFNEIKELRDKIYELNCDRAKDNSEEVKKCNDTISQHWNKIQEIIKNKK